MAGDASAAEVRALLKKAELLRARAQRVVDAPTSARHEAAHAFNQARAEIIERQLAAMPVERLKEVTQDRLVLGPLQQSKYSTVAAVLHAGARALEAVPGVGAQTATRAVAAARQLAAAMEESTRVRIDAVSRPASHAALIHALRQYDRAMAAAGAVEDDAIEFALEVEELHERAALMGRGLRRLFTGGKAKAAARAAVVDLAALLDAVATLDLDERLQRAEGLLQERAHDGDVWDDFASRAASYNGRLIEISGVKHDEEAVQGFLPSEIADAVNALVLDQSLLREVSLRGYQAFGAKFALVQRRTILGDEMGLGKTVEAIAALAHLRAEGATHFLVVCPASVLVNWEHEVKRWSELPVYRMHGAGRERSASLWSIRGGVGVTTYESLRSIGRPGDAVIGLIVVDEAHFVKNPDARRTQSVRSWLGDAQRALFLTGTPMENRVDEFRNLVGYLQPSIARSVTGAHGLAGAIAFRRAVAPVYLRRNQVDVLDELPGIIENQDWVELTGSDLDAYREAVRSKNFMAMRRAPFLSAGGDSAKLTRLQEIVEEAADNDRKVVVFSYFRDVIERILGAVGGLGMGPLTGSVPPVQRQELVDQFTRHRDPAVLVSQIEAGGTGLNIQAASVVILAEPQWKPSIENQAIARCHRMGQVRTVDVHRLLAEDSADQRMLEVLAEKAALFDEYVRKSDLATATPEAMDVSDHAATREVASQAEAERRIMEMERKRLGIEDDAA